MQTILSTEGVLLVHHREHQGGHGQEQGDEGQHQEVQGRGTEVGELRCITCNCLCLFILLIET